MSIYGKCPHCGHDLTTVEAATALHPDGFTRHIRIQGEHGQLAWVEAGDFNPLIMKALPINVDTPGETENC